MKHETFDTYIIFFPSPETLVYEISKNDFCNLFVKRELLFTFHKKFFMHLVDFVMESLLGPILAHSKLPPARLKFEPKVLKT